MTDGRTDGQMDRRTERQTGRTALGIVRALKMRIELSARSLLDLSRSSKTLPWFVVSVVEPRSLQLPPSLGLTPVGVHTPSNYLCRFNIYCVSKKHPRRF